MLLFIGICTVLVVWSHESDANAAAVARKKNHDEVLGALKRLTPPAPEPRRSTAIFISPKPPGVKGRLPQE